MSRGNKLTSTEVQERNNHFQGEKFVILSCIINGKCAGDVEFAGSHCQCLLCKVSHSPGKTWRILLARNVGGKVREIWQKLKSHGDDKVMEFDFEIEVPALALHMGVCNM